MSVINNVLKELDTRSSNFKPISITTVTALARDQKNINYNPFWALGFGALLAVSLLLHWFLSAENNYKPQQVRANNLSEKLTSQPSLLASQEGLLVQPSVNLVGNELSGLQIDESETSMRLQFALSKMPVSYLKQRSENTIVYHLEKLRAKIDSPKIEQNPWLKSLSIMDLNTGVDIEFRTQAGVLIETNYQKTQAGMFWLVTLKRKLAESPKNINEVKKQPKLKSFSKITVKPEIQPAKTLKQSSVKAKPRSLNIKIANKPNNAQAQLKTSQDLITSRQYFKAEKILVRLINGAEGIASRKQLLFIYARQQRLADLLSLARESMRKHPRQADFRSEYGRSLFQLAAYDSVIELFAGRQVKEHSQQALLAASYQRLGQHQLAIHYYQLALAQDRGNAKNWVALGVSLEHASQLKEALSSYQIAGRIGSLNERLQSFIQQRSRNLEKLVN